MAEAAEREGLIRYLPPVPARIARARELVGRARNAADDWPTLVGLLANACDYATAAVLLACGYPVASRKKIRAAADEHLGNVFGDSLKACDALWDEHASGHSRPTERVEAVPLGRMVEELVERLEGIVADPPKLELPPAPAGLGWEKLGQLDRDLLRQATSAVKAVMPNARVLLYGSRATGTSRVDSDCDLLVVLPAATPETVKAFVMASLYALGMSLGVELDREVVGEDAWNDPPPERQLHLDEVRRVSIEAPDDPSG